MTQLRETTVGTALSLQRTIDSAQLAMISVEDDAFAEYSDLVQRLIIRLGPLADEDGPWQEPVRLLRGIRTRMTLWPGDSKAAVAAMELPNGWPDGTIAALRPFSEENALLVAQAWECIERMSDDERQLGWALRTLVGGLADLGRSRVVVKSRFIEPTVSWLHSNTQRHPEVVSPGGLSGFVDFDRLVVIGPASWFPEHLRSVPRAAMTIVLSHSWVRDPSTSLAMLDALTGDVRDIGPPIVARTVGASTVKRGLRIDSDALLPGFSEADLGRMARRVLAIDSVSGNARDKDPVVESRMYVLASGEVVFLPTDDASRRDVAELSHEGISVARVPVGELRTGMFLLVRRSGASDYLAEMADRLLASDGEDPRALRDAHSRWQHTLREFVAPRGPTTAAAELRAAGVKVANASNVSRWMSGESLGLQKDANFRALLKHLGLQDEARGILLMTRHLRNAHQRAGAKVRQLLVERAERMSPAELEAAGHMDVELEKEEGGTLMLARIEQIASSTVMVPSGRVGIATVTA
jgi:hypothetical protein